MTTMTTTMTTTTTTTTTTTRARVTGQKEEKKEKEKEEKKFLHTGTQTDQSNVVQEVLANLKSKCFNNKDEICIHHQ